MSNVYSTQLPLHQWLSGAEQHIGFPVKLSTASTVRSENGTEKNTPYLRVENVPFPLDSYILQL